MSVKWRKFVCNKKELQLLGTLNGGQSFRWNMVKRDGAEQWIGVFAKKVWVLEQTDDHILYQVHEQSEEEPPMKKIKENEINEKYELLLKDYFRLDLNLEEYYAKWSEADPYFKEAAKQFYGIRILKQDLTENIFSFICSSNNNITRISSMVGKLAEFYGEKICNIDGVMYFSFPTVHDLAVGGVEENLKRNGFGYRAKYIANSAQKIVNEGGENWIGKLKEMEYEDAKKTLITLTGVGPKVADCISLMSLGHLQSIPVDTHIYQIAARFYMPKLAKQKTVTDKIYNEIGEHFRALYGPLAGWAHTVLFCADLKKFQIPTKDSTEHSVPPNVSKGKRKTTRTK